MSSIAIVTGASSGVGKEFVRQLDQGRGGPLDEIWALGRNEDALNELARSCHTIHVRPISLDLTDPASFDLLAQRLEDEVPHVEWLVNSAGFGTFGTFGDVGRPKNADMVRLNCLAVVEMISVALAYLHPGSRIINLSSIAGAVPQVELATYSASKAFVLELSRMLDHELSGAGIRVTAVCPKFMRTRFLDQPGDAHAASSMTRIGFEDVARVVDKAMAAALAGRPVCIPSLDMRAATIVAKHLPRTVLFALEDILFGRWPR